MSKRIIIIGGGVVGLSAAWYCREAGHEVVLLERGSPQRDCCSLGNAGLIVPSHIIPLAAPGMVSLGFKMMWNPESPFYIKPRLDPELFDWGMKFIRSCSPEHVKRSAPLLRDINFASKKLFEGFAAMPGVDFGLVKKGCLNLCKTPERLAHEAELAAMSRALGMPAEVLDADETRRLDPGVDMDILGSVYFPEDAHLSPNRFMVQLEQLVVKAGVDVRWQTEVSSFELTGERIGGVRSDKQSFTGDEFIIAGGAWSSRLGRQLGLKLPMQAGKGYSLTIERPRQLPELSYIFTEARLAVTPMMGALRVGGTMEIAGLDTSINPARIRGITKSAGRYFPALPPETFDGIKPWVGLRPCSPDGLPYVGRTRHFPNLSLGTGHAMMGLSLGPITGRLLAEVIDGRPPTVALELLDPDRFG
ncbi:MAG TPA: FAD-dependent oxidoreductase [Verrucomicrobiales bacterium]|nr:FAD-dependent oxidoreductase [Verrucomicrobiales bacterium]